MKALDDGYLKVLCRSAFPANSFHIGCVAVVRTLTCPVVVGTRIGIGININQEKFISDAPNPVSMINILRRETDLNDATARLGVFLELRLAEAADPVAAANLHTAFLRRLWRHDGAAHPFRIRETGRQFRGVIETVQPDGYLIVRDDESGNQLRFAFKEVEFLLA